MLHVAQHDTQWRIQKRLRVEHVDRVAARVSENLIDYESVAEKYEPRNPKFATNPNDRKESNKLNSDLDFCLSDFELRISNLILVKSE